MGHDVAMSGDGNIVGALALGYKGNAIEGPHTNDKLGEYEISTTDILLLVRQTIIATGFLIRAKYIYISK